MTGKSTAHRYALILIAAITASLLLVLSWPRLKASLHYLPVDTAISKYRESREIDTGQLGGLIERAGESIAIHDHYRYWDGLSELHVLDSQNPARSFWERRRALEESISAAEKAVRRAPTKPRTWLRIASAKEYLAYPSGQVIPALKMSILTGRVEPTLMLTRLELGLRYLHMMDAEGIHLVRDQAVLTWTTQKRPMLKRIESGHLGLALLREVMGGSNQAIISDIEGHFDE